MTTEMTEECASRWDRRVTKGGTPVPQYRPPWSRGWFTVRRAAGPEGVVLETRIPGYLAGKITEHDDQDAAEAAARQTWLRYAADVAAITGQDEQEIAAPWMN
jgi:hypothetical protein